MGVFLTGISLDPALIACDRVVEMSAEHEDECQSLKQRVAELELIADRLRGEKERAVESDRLKSAFIATMSHELRTPLNSIIGFTGILLQKISGPLTREQEKQLNLVQHSSRHLLALINDILDISKIEAGELRISFDPVNLHQVVEAAVRVVQPLASQKGLSIRTDLATGPVIISGDQRRIEQIVMNLLSNAVKFTETGMVTVTTRVAGGEVRLSVRDTGVGISQAEIPTLFEPFIQVDTGKSRRTEGTGLGLSISRRLVELHGGSLTVTSTPGAGSEFVVMLPASAGDSPDPGTTR